MNFKHFLKGLGAFMAIIILGLAGFYLVSYFEQNEKEVPIVNNQVRVAK